MTEYKVKGSTVRNKFAYVESNFGSQAEAAMTLFFKGKYGKTLFPIFSNIWYSYDLYVEVLEYIAQHHYGGDLKQLTRVGAASAQDALTSIYQSFRCGTDYLTFLKRISKLHSMFYSMGKTTAQIHENKKGCNIIHSGKPRYATADLYVASGFYQETARLHDLKGISCRFEMEPSGAIFTLVWD
ncbi:MAG: hypothetical protein QNJ97_14715 [Myxococcota bacterium]|nr:hypothetical protein [Myxococcota bacterium]